MFIYISPHVDWLGTDTARTHVQQTVVMKPVVQWPHVKLYNRTSVYGLLENGHLYTPTLVKCPVVQHSFLEFSIVQMFHHWTNGHKCLVVQVSIFQLSGYTIIHLSNVCCTNARLCKCPIVQISFLKILLYKCSMYTCHCATAHCTWPLYIYLMTRTDSAFEITVGWLINMTHKFTGWPWAPPQMIW